MALCREQLDKWKIRKLFPKPRSGDRKWLKNQFNRFVRRNINLFGFKLKRFYKGWEY